MQKVSNHIKAELKTAEDKRDNAPIREVSYWQGQVDALKSAASQAEIIELKNDK